MSYLGFVDGVGRAELAGHERAWLLSLAWRPAMDAWDLDGPATIEHRLPELIELLERMDDAACRGELVGRARWLAAIQQDWHRANEPYSQREVGASYVPFDHEAERAFLAQLRATLRVGDVGFTVAGRRLRHEDLALNTALAMGSDQVRLAAKISGWSFTFVEGPNREWLARLFEAGLEAGCYRAGGRWEEVVAFLRQRDDSPVVTYHSSGDYPGYEVADWSPDPLPEGWRPTGWSQEEWAGLDYQQDYRVDAEREQFDELPKPEQHQLIVAGLRKSRPWAELHPDTLGETYFGLPFTVYSLLAPDREDRLRQAVARHGSGE